jgi:hypothetical protein
MYGQFKGYLVHAFSRGGLSTRESADEIELGRWQPDDPDLFKIDFDFHAGPEGGVGSDAFGLSVCSPAWLLRASDQCAIFSPAHTLLMRRYDGAALLRFLREQCSSASGATWTAVALQIGRVGSWEFQYKVR